MEKNPFIYQLSEKIEYSKNGQFYETATIELKAPSMKVFDLSTKLSQLVMRATLDAKDFAEDYKSEESTNQEVGTAGIKMILMSSKSVSFSDISNVSLKLFLKVGTFDGETKLKEAIINRLDIEDYTDMICGYIANFIFPSLFSTEGERQAI